MSEPKPKTIVMCDSPEAAQPHTMDGWESRTGVFYADERSARYAGCTHIKCESCGEPTRKGWLACGRCRENNDVARYNKKPRMEWDGEAMLYSEVMQDFFIDPESAEVFIDDGQTLADLRLVICEPVYAHPLGSDYCSGDLPDDSDGSLPTEIENAIDTFNKAIAGVILSWKPGKYALAIEDSLGGATQQQGGQA